jgi:glutamate-1-semialdehyde 2,1-aminomutase
MTRYPAGEALYARALAVTPGGAQTLSKRRDRYGAGVPPFLVRGAGVRVWDVDGRAYLDYIASLAAVTLGHARPEITEAMARQLREGGTFALPHPLEVAVGERFLAATGWPNGMIRWVSSGSEATEAAVRVARLATGRDHVLSVGYHGWHSTWTAARAIRPGVPAAFARVIHEVPAGVVEALDEAAQAVGRDQVAAVIIEPCADAPPDAGYLRALRAWTHQHGICLISDEIIAGFRWAVAGAMLGVCGVRPDLVTFGKAISNGAFPIAAVAGPAPLMAHAWPVSGTANGHPVGLAAVDAVLRLYRETQPLLILHAAGRRLRAALAACAGRSGGGLIVVGGDDPRPTCRVVTGDAERDRIGQTLLSQELAARGLLWHPAGAGNLMLGHEAVLGPTVDAFTAACALVVEALASPDPGAWLAGAPTDPMLRVR